MKYLHFRDFNPLYSIVEASRNAYKPSRLWAMSLHQLITSAFNPLVTMPASRALGGSLDLFERITRHYTKPEFGIKECVIDGRAYEVREEVQQSKPFCRLLHFSKKNINHILPKLLIVAPMAGHHATLLRNTVQETLPYFDVYITDWIDASQVPCLYGKFDMDDYIDYIIEFLQSFHESINVLAVCQPTVPVLAAASIMSSYGIDPMPHTLTLIGGPIDARRNPTEVNHFATEHDLEWFKECVTMQVPANYPGAGRMVYPGFLQLAGFMSMNWEKHASAYAGLYLDILAGDHEKVATHKKFYDEYLSVMDLTSEFYLQTIQEVFQKFSLAKGKMVSRNRHVNLARLKGPAIFGIEGEKDDIAAVGQTKAALTLCQSIPDEHKRYHLQKDAGHYGIFSGSKFRKYVVPLIRDFVYKYDHVATVL